METKYLFLFIFLYNFTFSQNFKKATYSITTSFNEKVNTLPENLKKMIIEADDAAEFLSPILYFNDTISAFKLEGNSIITNDLAVSNVCKCKKTLFVDIINKKTYRNNSSTRAFKEDEFIITDSLNTNWLLTSETKKIENYLCYKATQDISMSNGTKNADGSLKFFKKTITAWFSPEIPYSFGPGGYGGLPGLIVELQDENKTFGLVKLELSIQNNNINLPNKGSFITIEEYNNQLKIKTNEFIKSKEN